MKLVKIRYKTDAKPNDVLQWRVLIDGVESHASEVHIFCPSFTTKDILEGGVEKWHITCHATTIDWEDKKCMIK